MNAPFLAWSWSELGFEILNGTSVALTWAVLVWCYINLKDWKIKRKITASIDSHPNVEWRRKRQESGLAIHNDTAWPVTVRQVTLLFEGESWTLRPMEEISSESSDRKGGEYVQLRPYSHSSWGAPITRELASTIIGGFVTIEYESPLGEARLRQIKFSEKQLLLIKENFGIPSASAVASSISA